MVIVPVSVVTALLLVLVMVTLISILWYRHKKSTRNGRIIYSVYIQIEFILSAEVVLRTRAMGPVYEEVDSMILNPQYMSQKLHITRTHASSSVLSPDSLQQGDGCNSRSASKTAKALESCLETETYEVMKSGVSVKQRATTTENCYIKSNSDS